uniref:hypoxia-inducible factor-proline dioxygenase n=1 Tax=Rhipicephalus zambeziensis TaxID=60191 RepID=A0A224Z292_9ACAR
MSSVTDDFYCQFCGSTSSLRRCAQCHGIYYCSKEHQRLHWPAHKHICKHSNAQHSSASPPPLLVADSASVLHPTPPMTPVTVVEALAPSMAAPIPPDAGIAADIPNYDPNDPVNQAWWNDTLSSLGLGTEGSGSDLANNAARPEALKPLSSKRFQKICADVVHDLKEYGICVIDKFLGKERGSLVFDEVYSLYGSGEFQHGQLVSERDDTGRIIRGDRTLWLDGTEAGFPAVGFLVRTLDAIISRCNKSQELRHYCINQRTKAMIACYPGNGTHYVKHVDNPNQDGRCITSIYYLNKNWDVQTQGGLLRMFPVGQSTSVANIEPIFDRMLFFWSDRRNPHEVLPAYSIRFAITVWYLDANERKNALRRLQKEPNKQVPNYQREQQVKVVQPFSFANYQPEGRQVASSFGSQQFNAHQ